MPERSRSAEVEFHRRRARSERDAAYGSANAAAADAHMRLSVLHLQRALLLEAMDRGPVGNIHPFPNARARRVEAYASDDQRRRPFEPGKSAIIS